MVKHRIIVFAVALMISGVIPVMAQEPAGLPQPSPEHKKLAAFLGTWKDEAEMKPSPFGPGVKFTIVETCEWFTGGFSLVCHSETTGFLGQKTLTVLTYDPEDKVYLFYEFNSLGQTNSAKGTVEGDTWTWNGESKVGGKLVKSRTTIKLPTPDSATFKSEVSVGGGPSSLLMELKGTRLK